MRGTAKLAALTTGMLLTASLSLASAQSVPVRERPNPHGSTTGTPTHAGTPEPATLLLGGSAVAGYFVTRFVRKQKNSAK